MSRNGKKIVALIPLRGGSKSIKKKNIKKIAGKPLCEWVLNAALGSSCIDEVYVSTESNEIKTIVKKINNNIHVIDRPDSLAQDESSTEDVMIHFMNNVDFDILLTLQATSPLTTSGDIDAAIDKYIASDLDSLVTVVRTKRFIWTDDGKPVNYNPAHRPRRQEFDGILVENGAFYITARNILKEKHCRLGGKIGIFEMREETFYEIDEPVDWDIVEKLLLTKDN